MNSPEDGGEELLNTVSNYYFVDENDELISFSELPIKWDDDIVGDGEVKEIFLKGDTNKGLQKFHSQVKAWKFNILLAKPSISVLSTKNDWIALQKPERSFLDTLRTVLVTVHLLHLLRRYPRMFLGSLWDNIAKSLRLHEPKPSQNDLLDHLGLVREVMKRDRKLANSNVLNRLLEKVRKNKELFEDIGTLKDCNSLTDENEDGAIRNEMEYDVCVICDNGGDVLSCAECLRSFHATKKAGVDLCDSLGLSEEYVEGIEVFVCENCKFKEHQCFACGELGSSDKSSGPEVFCCANATCGQYYHPHCVAAMLQRDNKSKAGELQEKIAAGAPFSCPIHQCYVCKLGENKNLSHLQFAVCRRCPKSYHRKCLPREITFAGKRKGGIPRAWREILPDKRILIYCLDHDIDAALSTPVRNHIVFPHSHEKRKQEVLQPIGEMQVTSKGNELGDWARKRKRKLHTPKSSGKRKVLNTLEKASTQCSDREVDILDYAEGNTFSERNLNLALIRRGLEAIESLEAEQSDGEPEQTQRTTFASGETHCFSALDADSKRRILSLIKKASSCITLEDIRRKHAEIIAKENSSKPLAKCISLEDVEAGVVALQAAAEKLEKGVDVEIVQAVLKLLNQIMRWRDIFKEYLAPFLYSTGYTCLARNFAKVDKLNEIVDRLHSYVEDGDMIVDFFCGSNDFSTCMKTKLEELGKCCSYKSYNIFQSKNGSRNERRDWTTISPGELLAGSKLIMGLNMSIGVEAGSSGSFIDKILQLKPKLLILIVAQEAECVEIIRKELLYDLIWEDDELLGGESYYSPGAVDGINKVMERRDSTAPRLCLWSRPDWTSTHNSVAKQHGHLTRITELKPHRMHLGGTNPEYGIHRKELLEDHNTGSFGEMHLESEKHMTELPQSRVGVKTNRSRMRRESLGFSLTACPSGSCGWLKE